MDLDNEKLAKFYEGIKPKKLHERGRFSPRPKGSGSITRRRKDGLYEVRVTYRLGKERHRKSVYCSTREEATVELAKLITRHGLHPKGSKMSLRALVDQWLASVEDSVEIGKKKKTTLDLYRGTWNRHIKNYLGSKYVDNLTVEDVTTWLSTLRREHVPPRTRQLALSVLSRALNIAVRREFILRNPCALLDEDSKPSALKRKVHILDLKQVQQLLKTAKGSPYEALLTLAVLTGLRQGELFALRLRDIDLAKGTVTVDATLTKDAHGKITRMNPKTESSRRTLALPKLAIKSLERHIRQLKATDKNDWLFPAPGGGKTVKHNFIRRVYKPLLEKAKLPDTTFHSLRHVANSLLLNKGVPIKVIQERGGWTTTRMPLDVYGHPESTMQQQAADALDSMFSKGSVSR